MITYVLTLSENFPSFHPKHGEPTRFNESLTEALLEERGMQPLDSRRKRHTIRANYEFWSKRFEKIAAGKAVLSVRQWVGKPYGKGSTQKELALLTRLDGIGIQRLDFDRQHLCHPRIDGKAKDNGTYRKLAQNDGLTEEEWLCWFREYDLSHPMAIIHFTSFRY